MAAWAATTGVPIGATFAPGVLWDLGRRWYDDRLAVEWRRRSAEERQRILDEVGLTGEFWRLRPPG